ncbi:MAG TPA: TIGR04083 family peptide-modifying radical SAM enzyme [Methanoregulaceae archaeon]|nr:TIGR04083 family peptide-modifying radical SAM enzyme [Methanoregulaceae archaeon]
MKTPFHVMLIPTLRCPARCAYCWSSDHTGPMMDLETVRAATSWIASLNDDPVTITFHGGEPLLAGSEFYEAALPMIEEGLAPRTVAFAMQSNLWLLDDRLAAVLAIHNVPIGTSIDGPPALNDAQRGTGYFERTRRGMEVAARHGVRVSVICTFTAKSVKERDAIVRFFLENGYVMKLHPALPSLRDGRPDAYALPPEEYGELLVYLLDQYLSHLGRLRVMNIDDLVKSVFVRRGTVCTFADCLGTTYAVGPDGGIYPCYRFVGMDEWRMGDVRDAPTRAELEATPAWQRLAAFREYVDEHCAGCRHIRYCRGGCPYNALAPTGGAIAGVDPHCAAYKRIYDEIADRLNAEMFGEGGMEAMLAGQRRGGRPGIMALMQRMVSR